MPLILTAALACTVHDGDTIRCGSERIRIANIDAPELPGSPKCDDRRKRYYAWCDYAAGAMARDALRGFMARGTVSIERSGIDRYGRTLARISVNGVDVGEWLIARGLARRWR